MRTVPPAMLDSILNHSRTVKAKLYISDQRPKFDVNYNPFGTGEINVTSNISIDENNTWYDAKLLTYTVGQQKYYVIFRAIINSNGYLCYWVYDTAGRNTNGWVVSNSYLGSADQTSLSINETNGSIYFVRNNTIFRRTLYYNNGWNLTAEQSVSNLPSSTRYRIVHTQNPALEFIVMGEYLNSYPRDYIFARHRINSYHPDIQDQNIGAVDAVGYYTRGNIPVWSPNSLRVSATTIYDTFDAEWINGASWSPDGEAYTARKAKYGKDLLVIFNSLTNSVDAVSIRPGFVGSSYDLLNNDPSIDDIYISPIQICGVGDDLLMLAYIGGLSTDVFCFVAKNVTNRPITFNIIDGADTGADLTIWKPHLIRAIPLPDQKKVLIFPSANGLFVSPYHYLFDSSSQIEIGEVSSIQVRSETNNAISATATVDLDVFMDKLQRNNITDPRLGIYSLYVGYDNHLAKIGEFTLEGYSIEKNSSGEVLELSLISRGLGRLSNIISPFSYEVLAPDLHTAAPIGDTDEKRSENFFKNITVTNGAINLVGTVAEAANNTGNFTNPSHPLHRCAMFYFNTSGRDSGYLEIGISRTHSTNKWGILARYTLEASGTTVYHRGLLFQYSHAEEEWKIYFMDTRRTNPLQLYGQVSHPSASYEKLYFYNPCPGSYKLYNVVNGQLNLIFSVDIPEYYSSEYSVERRGYYGLCLWSSLIGEDSAISPYLNEVHFTHLDQAQSVLDALIGLCYYSGAKDVVYRTSVNDYVTNFRNTYGLSIVFDGVIYPSPTSSKIVLRTLQDDPWEKVEVYRDKIITHKYTWNVDIANSSIKKIKIFGNNQMFIVYVEETPYLVIRNEDETSPMRVIADQARITIKDLSIQVDSNIIDVGSPPFQHLSKYLQERWIFLRDHQDGGVRIYRFWGDTYNMAPSGKTYGMVLNSSQVSRVFSAAPFTHVRAFSDVVRDVIDTGAIPLYGYRLQVVNAETLLGREQTYSFAKNIIEDSISQSSTIQLVMPIDPRIEVGDLIRFDDDDNYYLVQAYSWNAAQTDREATGQANLVLRKKPNYLEIL